MKFSDFAMILAIFSKIHDFSRPGKCIFKFNDFYDRVNPDDMHWNQARNQPVFSGKPGMISRYHFVCPVPSFSEMKEIG